MKTILFLSLLLVPSVRAIQEKPEPPPRKAQELLDEARKKAGEDKEKPKRVLLTFSSPG